MCCISASGLYPKGYGYYSSEGQSFFSANLHFINTIDLSAQHFQDSPDPQGAAVKACIECNWSPGNTGIACSKNSRGNFGCCIDGGRCLANDMKNRTKTTYYLQYDVYWTTDLTAVKPARTGVIDTFSCGNLGNIEAGKHSKDHTCDDKVCNGHVERTVDIDGTLIWAYGHQHVGAINASLYNLLPYHNGKYVCTSTPHYGTDPANPVGNEKGSATVSTVSGIGMGKFADPSLCDNLSQGLPKQAMDKLTNHNKIGKIKKGIPQPYPHRMVTGETRSSAKNGIGPHRMVTGWFKAGARSRIGPHRMVTGWFKASGEAALSSTVKKRISPHPTVTGRFKRDAETAAPRQLATETGEKIASALRSRERPDGRPPPAGDGTARVGPKRCRPALKARRLTSRKLLNKRVHALNGNTMAGWKRAAQGGKGHKGGKGAGSKPVTQADIDGIVKRAVAQALKGQGAAPQPPAEGGGDGPKKVPVVRDSAGNELRQDPTFEALCPPLMLAREDFLRNHGATAGKKLWNEAGKKLAARAKALARGETPEQMLENSGGAPAQPAKKDPAKKTKTERQRVQALLREAKKSELSSDVEYLEGRLRELDAKEAERPANRLKKVEQELVEVSTMLERLEALGVDTAALAERKAALEAERSSLDGGTVEDDDDEDMDADDTPRLIDQAREALVFLEQRSLPTAEVQGQLDALLAKQQARAERAKAKEAQDVKQQAQEISALRDQVEQLQAEQRATRLTVTSLEARVEEADAEVRRLRLVEATAAGHEARLQQLEPRAQAAGQLEQRALAAEQTLAQGREVLDRHREALQQLLRDSSAKDEPAKVLTQLRGTLGDLAKTAKLPVKRGASPLGSPEKPAQQAKNAGRGAATPAR